METEERRRLLLQKLKSSDCPVTGQDLAEAFHVSRQIIVSDMAMLRAGGEKIIATARGYLIEPQEKEAQAWRLWSSSAEALRRELEIIVDNGGLIRGVSVDYGPYGEISCAVDLSSRRDIQKWAEQLRALHLQPLSLLAGGAHTLFVKVRNEEDQEERLRLLDAAGFLEKPQS